MKIKEGMEVVVGGKWAIVTSVEDGIWIMDEDGGEREVSEAMIDSIRP
jgi:hypothetical protein